MRSGSGRQQVKKKSEAQMETPQEMRRVGLEITDDLTDIRCVIEAMLEKLNEGKKSRERLLVITKLQEAFMWAGEGLRLE